MKQIPDTRKLAKIAFSLIGSFWLTGMALSWVRETAPPEEPWPGASYIELPSGRTHYIDIGPKDAPVILLFHGSGRGIADWQEGFATALAQNHRVVGFDYYGNGFSDRGHGLKYGYNLWSQQAVELLDALDIERSTFVGHSVGGVVATVAALDYPDRTNGLVTIGTGTAIDPAQIIPLVPGLGDLLLGMKRNYSDTFSEQHAKFINQAHNIRGSRWAFLVYLRRQYTIDGLRIINGLYGNVPVPTLHASGSADRSVPHESARKLALETGGAWAPFENMGHDLHIDAPEELAVRVTGFVSGLEN